MSKKYFLNLLFLFLSLCIYSQKRVEYYRSNSNGLSLVKINANKRNDYKFILKVDLTGDITLLKTLFKENVESKRWEFFYAENNILETEKYYKDLKIKEEYRYNRSGHKVKQTEFLNGNAISITIFYYNKEGLVEKEEILNLISNKTTYVKYKYDKDFRIKQIEKIFPDGKSVFWESFFTPKGIIVREFYTLEDEIFTFYYNESGQELKGEVKERSETGEEKPKISWENFYSQNGKRKRRVHNNFLINKKVDTTYNKNFKEIKVETYYNDNIFSIEEYDYNNKNLVSYYKKIVDLNLSEEYYTYDEKDNLSETKIYQDKELKKHIFYNKDGSRKEVVFSKNRRQVEVFYNIEGKLIQ
ncbi:MAG TPA: hypothetical protein PK771_06090 [Spirochaetota bacterium]|nr:hypothetical protein [Spirochaetota bacterium]